MLMQFLEPQQLPAGYLNNIFVQPPSPPVPPPHLRVRHDRGAALEGVQQCVSVSSLQQWSGC